MLDNNSDRFTFSLENIEPFTGEPLRIDLNFDKPIFRPPHKLGQVEWDFVQAQCEKLEIGIHPALHPVHVRVCHGGGTEEGRGRELY